MIDIPDNDAILEAIELLYFGYRAFTEGPDELLAKHGLNRAHHRILYFIARNEGLSVSELLNTLSISKQALNTPLRQLVSMELVKNRKSSSDARYRELRLTANGKRLEKRLTKSQHTQLQSIFNAVGPEAHLHWRKVMLALADKSTI